MNVLALKQRLIPLICHPVVGQLMATAWRNRLPHHGAVIHTDHPAVVPGAKARLVWGLYEKAETQFVQRYLPAGHDVVELGSSLGVVTAHIARKLEHGRRLICVEANPMLAAEISRNVATNAPGQQLEVVTAAIDYSGRREVPFRLAQMNVDSRVATACGADTVAVEALALSTLLNRYNVGDYSLVMDIEGAEAEILLSDAAALERCQAIIAEFHEASGAFGSLTIEEMGQIVTSRLGFLQVARRGDIFAFTRIAPE